MWWIRFFGLVARGSTRIYLAQLEERFAVASGQGGGGALSVDELIRVLLVDSVDPILIKRSILHTDSAKAYRRIGPMQWPEAGAHHTRFQRSDPFSQFDWCHTNVTHKHKPGQPIQYVAHRTVVLPTGEHKHCLGGTQKVDGFWAFLANLQCRQEKPTLREDSGSSN